MLPFIYLKTPSPLDHTVQNVAERRKALTGKSNSNNDLLISLARDITTSPQLMLALIY
jgi:hypothetical protein